MKRQLLAPLAVAAALLGVVAAPSSSAWAARRVTPHSFSFLAQVVKSGPTGLLVRASSGKKLWFPASELSRGGAAAKPARRHHSHAAKHAARIAVAGPASSTPTVTVSIVGLQPGVTVQITETVAANGDITITITLPPTTATSEQSASGVVDEVDDSDFYVNPGDGTDLEFNIDADTLANLNLSPCDTVTVTYHQDAGVLIADTVAITGNSSAGDCAPTNDVDGTITQVSGSGLAIQSDQGPMSFVVDSSDVTDGFSVGDVVDVTYSQETGGALDASDVEYVEGDDTGIVTAVTVSSLKIADSTTGEPDVFIADPAGLQLNTDAFTGIAVGDSVDVCFHTTAGGLVADTITDSGPSGGPSGTGGSGGPGGSGGSGGSGGPGGSGGSGGSGH
jgi:uncharacterized membrane protein YgcG